MTQKICDKIDIDRDISLTFLQCYLDVTQFHINWLMKRDCYCNCNLVEQLLRYCLFHRVQQILPSSRRLVCRKLCKIPDLKWSQKSVWVSKGALDQSNSRFPIASLLYRKYNVSNLNLHKTLKIRKWPTISDLSYVWKSMG